MRLFLHIGTEKTATTSTQMWFRGNRAALSEQGIFYSKVLGQATHRKLCLWALNPRRKDEGFQNHNLHSPKLRADFRSSLPKLFAAEVDAARKAGAHSFVISNEHLHSRLRSAAEVRRVQEFLTPHFEDISVLCFLRPQVDVAVSLTSTVARDRFPITKAFFEKVTPERSFYNYQDLVVRWSTVFGKDAVKVLAFRKWPTAAQYLISELGVDTKSTAVIPRVNEAVDVRVMAMVNSLGAPVFGSGLNHNRFSRLFIDKLACEEKISIGPKLARRVQGRFDASNQALLAARPDLEPEDLKPDWAKYSTPSNLVKLEQDVVFSKVLSQLVRVFNEKLVFEELQTQIARTERALARHHLKRAGKLADRCVVILDQLTDAQSVQEDLVLSRAIVLKLVQRIRHQLSALEGKEQ